MSEKKKLYSFKFEQSLIDKFDKKAEKLNKSRSGLIRQFIKYTVSTDQNQRVAKDEYQNVIDNVLDFTKVWDKAYKNEQVTKFFGITAISVKHDFGLQDLLLFLRQSTSRINKEEYRTMFKSMAQGLDEDREFDVAYFRGLSGKISPLQEAVSNYHTVMIPRVDRAARNVSEWVLAVQRATALRHDIIDPSGLSLVYGSGRLLGFMMAIFAEYELLSKQTTVRKDALEYFKFLWRDGVEFDDLSEDFKLLSQVLAYSGDEWEQSAQAKKMIKRQLKRSDLTDDTVANLRDIWHYISKKMDELDI